MSPSCVPAAASTSQNPTNPDQTQTVTQTPKTSGQSVQSTNSGARSQGTTQQQRPPQNIVPAGATPGRDPKTNAIIGYRTADGQVVRLLMATPGNNTNQGMVFDASGIHRHSCDSCNYCSVHASTNQSRQRRRRDNSGMVFDSAPITQALTLPTSSSSSTTPSQPATSDKLFGGSWGTGTVSANPQPTTAAGKVERWAQNVSDNLKYGTDLTGIGTVMKKMGAHGVYSGQPEGVGDFIASLPLGLLKTTAGLSEVAQSGKRMQGAGNTVSGALQAATIPGSFAGPGSRRSWPVPVSMLALLA